MFDVVVADPMLVDLRVWRAWIDGLTSARKLLRTNCSVDICVRNLLKKEPGSPKLPVAQRDSAATKFLRQEVSEQYVMFTSLLPYLEAPNHFVQQQLFPFPHELQIIMVQT